MLCRMTIDAHAASQEPLLTERDMVTRIRDLLAPSSNPAQLWVLVLDGHGYQTPILIPIDERPAMPEPSLVDGLVAALGTLIDENLEGDGQVLFVVERNGPFGPTNQDQCWAAALSGSCSRAGLRLAGTFLLSPGGVSPIAA